HAEPGSAEEEEFLGIPGLLEPEQVSALLRKRQAEQLAVERRRRTGDPRDDRTAAEDLASLRRQLNSLVGAWNHRTGKPHGVIHTELRAACGGPAIPQATAEDSRQGVAKIREWAAKRRHWPPRPGLAGSAGDHRVAGEFDALPLQFLQGLVDGVLAHPGGEVEEDPRAETAAGRVHGGGADAVVGGDADDVDRVDAAGGEPVGERLLVVRDALEAAVAGRLAALAEHRLDGLQREVRVEVGAGR